mmetsp:Transcript_18330/g.32837  ORF Transcript_18330/g.32837 Transcript_18330/m.32837 type:complete len:311 (+) Transcript_18330:379-1311(+)
MDVRVGWQVDADVCRTVGEVRLPPGIDNIELESVGVLVSRGVHDIAGDLVGSFFQSLVLVEELRRDGEAVARRLVDEKAVLFIEKVFLRHCFKALCALLVAISFGQAECAALVLAVLKRRINVLEAHNGCRASHVSLLRMERMHTNNLDPRVAYRRNASIAVIVGSATPRDRSSRLRANSTTLVLVGFDVRLADSESRRFTVEDRKREFTGSVVSIVVYNRVGNVVNSGRERVGGDDGVIDQRATQGKRVQVVVVSGCRVTPTVSCSTNAGVGIDSIVAWAEGKGWSFIVKNVDVHMTKLLISVLIVQLE